MRKPCEIDHFKWTEEHGEMPKPYQMKNLGYKRTPWPIEHGFLFTFRTGEQWFVPLQMIADHYDAFYADEQMDCMADPLFSEMYFRGGLKWWVEWKMKWRDLEDHAIQMGNVIEEKMMLGESYDYWTRKAKANSKRT